MQSFGEGNCPVSEPLKCIGTEQVIVNYQLFFYESLRFSVLSRKQDTSAGFGGTVYARNRGGISYQVFEIPELRRYQSVGSYTHCTGTGYFMLGHIGEILGSAVQTTDIFDREIWAFPSAFYPWEYGLIGGIPKHIIDGWLANGTGWQDYAGYPKVYYTSECPENPSGYSNFALSVSLLGTFQEFISYWDFQVFDGGDLIYSRSDPTRTEPYGFDFYADYVVGSGQNRWGSPEEVNPETGYKNLTVTITPPRVENRTFTYNKFIKSNGIRIVNTINNGQTLFKIEEVNPTTNEYYSGRIIYRNAVASVDSYSLNCEGGCPPGTCEVDCGDKYCCYGSDGIAVASYLK